MSFVSSPSLDLKERSGTRMVVVQDGPQQENEKPLRIYGDPQKVEHAKQLVYDLIAEKEMEVNVSWLFTCLYPPPHLPEPYLTSLLSIAISFSVTSFLNKQKKNNNWRIYVT